MSVRVKLHDPFILQAINKHYFFCLRFPAFLFVGRDQIHLVKGVNIELNNKRPENVMKQKYFISVAQNIRTYSVTVKFILIGAGYKDKRIG